MFLLHTGTAPYVNMELFPKCIILDNDPYIPSKLTALPEGIFSTHNDAFYFVVVTLIPK